MTSPPLELNALIDRLSSSGYPLHELAKQTIWLKLDKAGIIKGLWCVDKPLNENLIEDLLHCRNVLALFNLGGHADLEQAAALKAYLPLRQEFVNLAIDSFSKGFYTDLPSLTLRILPTGNDEFLGLIGKTELLPNMDYASPILILLADREEKIRGFNHNFLELFSDRAKAPAGLLGQPLHSFLSPTPGDIQQQYFQKLDPGKTWTTEASIENLSDSLVQPHAPAHLTVADGAMVWENPTDKLDFILFSAPLDLHANDYRLSVHCSPLAGSGPLIILGAEKNGRYDPDNNGYLSGELPNRNGFILKRRGFVVDWSKEIPRPGQARYGLSKTDSGLQFEADRKPVLKFFDPHFLINPKPCFSIGLRPGGKTLLHRIALERRKSGETAGSGAQKEIIVKFNTSPSRFFSLTPFYNFSLHSIKDDFPDIRAYALSDVTTLQGKATLYRQQYESEKRKGRKLKTLLDEYSQPQELFVGASPMIRKIKDKASVIAGAQAPVLIEGPTGTGKEVLAHYIHEISPRKNGPFIKVDCSTLPAELIESELFGHERGSFTGAVDQKIGRFEQAHGGTLFLDEVSNLNRTIQAKLLNVLQDMAITRVGGSRVIQLNVRLLTASNVPLEDLIRMGAFREDLFYRLNTVTLKLPPLKDRTEDIPTLCNHFLQVFNANRPKPIQGLTAAAYRKLLAHPWPGNVRELKNALHRAVMFCETELISDDLINLGGGTAPEKNENGLVRKSYHLKDMNRKKWIALAVKSKGVISDMIKELGISRPACYHNLAKHQIDIKKYRRG